MLSERAGHRVEIFTPQRGQKRAILDLVKNNAAHSFEQRFRVMKPTSKAIGEALQNALGMLEEPERIECFDISHMQGSDSVASMVVWEKGRMKKSDYRKFIIRGESSMAVAADNGTAEANQTFPKSNGDSPLRIYHQNDDFASMRE